MPFNIASYATLAFILEKITGYKAIAIQGDLKKVHLYDNSINSIKLQIERDCDKHKGCELDTKIVDKLTGIKSVDKILDGLAPDDFQLVNYSSYPNINIKMLERDE